MEKLKLFNKKEPNDVALVIKDKLGITINNPPEIINAFDSKTQKIKYSLMKLFGKVNTHSFIENYMNSNPNVHAVYSREDNIIYMFNESKHMKIHETMHSWITQLNFDYYLQMGNSWEENTKNHLLELVVIEGICEWTGVELTLKNSKNSDKAHDKHFRDQSLTLSSEKSKDSYKKQILKWEEELELYRNEEKTQEGYFSLIKFFKLNGAYSVGESFINYAVKYFSKRGMNTKEIFLLILSSPPQNLSDIKNYEKYFKKIENKY